MTRRERLLVLTHIVLLVLWVLFAWGIARAEGGVLNELHPSISGAMSYQTGGWEKSPDGHHKTTDLPWYVEARLQWMRWKYQPTLSLEYGEGHFDFFTPQAPIQESSPKMLSGYIGVTREFKHLNIFALVGQTHIWFDPKLVENTSNGSFPHKGTPEDSYLVFKVGVNKIFKASDRVSIGPEISMKIYPDRPGFERCRTFKMNYVEPMVGLRIQF